jgi:hypothetical protein
LWRRHRLTNCLKLQLLSCAMRSSFKIFCPTSTSQRGSTTQHQHNTHLDVRFSQTNTERTHRFDSRLTTYQQQEKFVWLGLVCNCRSPAMLSPRTWTPCQHLACRTP